MSAARIAPPFAHSAIAEAIEMNGHTDWDRAVDAINVGFADTEPSSIPMRLAGGDPRYAPTMPSPLSKPRTATAAAPRGARPEPELDEVLLEARRNNRVCPQPPRWLELFDILQRKAAGTSLQLPAPPLTGKAWTGTRSLAKRMCFREQLEWAAAHGCLGVAYDFLKTLPDADWHFMGE